MRAGGRTARIVAALGRGWPSAILLGGVFVFLRAPSLVEPTWYSDEGTYADIGRALLHGASLYRDVWDNKPPGIYWLAAGITATVGPAGAAFPALLAIAVALAATGVWILGSRMAGRSTAVLATLTFIAVASVPNLEGDLFNAEIIGAMLVVWALVVLTGDGGPTSSALWRPTVAGALVGTAILFKGVFVFDLLAVAAVPLWWAWADGRPARGVAAGTAAVVAGAAAAVAAGVAVVAATGSVAGLLDVLVHQDVNYLQVTNGPNGSVIVGAQGGTRLLFTALLVGRVVVPLAALGAVAWRSVRSRSARSRSANSPGRRWRAVVAWWLGCDLAGTMLSARGFPHYAAQAAPAVSLVAGVAALAAWRHTARIRPAMRVAAAAAVLGAWPLLQLSLVIPRAEVAWANGAPFPGLESDSLPAARVGEYYRLGWGRLLGSIRPARFDALFPTDLARQRATVALFTERSRPGDRVFVWGTIHWSYALSNRMPAGRYVSLNSAYLVDPGSERRLVAELAAHPPAVLVVDETLPPGVSDLVHRLDYRLDPGAAAGDDVWLAPWTASVAP